MMKNKYHANITQKNVRIYIFLLDKVDFRAWGIRSKEDFLMLNINIFIRNM